MIEWILAGVLIIVFLWAILVYNGLIRLKNEIENAWSQIDVQLKKRYDLVPNLVETVKAYAKYERETFEKVVEARNKAMNATNTKSRAEAENLLTGALKSIFALSEDYPKLQANQNFLMLQEELSGIESKIAYSRQLYNDTVLKYNTKIQVIPDSIIANMLGFKEKDYFEIEQTEREVVKVKF